MKRLLILPAFFLLSCGSGTEIPLDPVTSGQSRAIQLALRLGEPVPELPLAAGADADCRGFVANLPAGFSSGFVDVPEDWSRPEGRRIRVFHYERLEAGKPPVVFYNGGPSSDSHSSFELLERVSAARTQSFIYIDQRGTGCSDPYPTDPSSETAARLARYGSRSIVLDSEAIRERVLGAGSRWKAFGQSYGGLIVHRYAAIASASLNGAYAHGFSLMSDPVEWLSLRMLSQKRVLEDYFRAYPGDRALLTRLRGLVPEKLCFTDQRSRVCGPSVLDAGTILLGFRNSWSQLHQWLASLHSADGALNEGALRQFVRYFVFGVYAHNGFAASIIGKVELGTGDSDAESCRKVERRLRERGEKIEDWLLNECRVLAALVNNEWGPVADAFRGSDPLTLGEMARALADAPSLPFFLYSGRKDVFVPVETFREEVVLLGRRIGYREFPSSGHEGFYTEAQVWKDLSAF